MTRYVLDTHLYIDAIRSVEKAQDLERFYEAFLPFTFLSSVVVVELLAGARPGAGTALERDLILPFERRGRILLPSHQAHKLAGRALAAMAGGGGMAAHGRGLLNDALLAASCREAGATLVTGNARDFRRLRQAMAGFEFVAPWPQR